MATKRLEADQLELHPPEEVHGIGVELRVLLQWQAHVFEQRHRSEQRPALIHDADFSENGVACGAFRRHDVVAVDEYPSGHRLIETDHVLEHRALAGSGAAENDENLAAGDREVDVLHQHAVAVACSEVLDADDRFGRHAQRSQMSVR